VSAKGKKFLKSFLWLVECLKSKKCNNLEFFSSGFIFGILGVKNVKIILFLTWLNTLKSHLPFRFAENLLLTDKGAKILNYFCTYKYNSGL